MRPQAKINLPPALLLLVIIIQISRVVPRFTQSLAGESSENRRYNRRPSPDDPQSASSSRSTPLIINDIFPPTLIPKTEMRSKLSPVEAHSVLPTDKDCRTSSNNSLFSAAQRRFCQAHPIETWLMDMGAEAALKECHRAFKNDRWDCSLVKKGPAGLIHNLVSGSREASFVNALTAGAMTHSLVNGCASGTLRNCRCDRELHGRALPDFPKWKWGGCSTDLRQPMRLNRKFMEAASGSRTTARPQDHVDRHNHMAGRLAVKYTRQTMCRCHGTSGACNLKTCWKTLAPLHGVREYLQRRYNQAHRVEQPQVQDGQVVLQSATGRSGGRDRYNSVERNRAIVEPTRHRRRQSRHGSKHRLNDSSPVKPKELIYTSDPIDYCKYDPHTGSQGTGGRRCTKENAEYLCCGRGYAEQWTVEAVACKCRFEWCCEVHCQTCLNRTLVRTCNY